MPGWQETYPAVYNRLGEQYRGLPESQVEALLEGLFGEGFGLAAAEGFFDDVGHALSSAARAAAPVLQRALPGVVSGAMSGAALGPYGMLGGALLGGLGSALGGGRPAAPRAPAPGAVPGAPPAGPMGAIGQLLGALGSPTVQQALGAMMLGPAGAHTVPTPGGNQLPVAAITNLLGMLSGRASAEWEAIVPTAGGESVDEAIDLASPEARAEWVFQQLAPVEGLGEDAESSNDESADEAWIDELYDEWEAELFGDAEPYDEAAYDETFGARTHG